MNYNEAWGAGVSSQLMAELRMLLGPKALPKTPLTAGSRCPALPTILRGTQGSAPPDVTQQRQLRPGQDKPGQAADPREESNYGLGSQLSLAPGRRGLLGQLGQGPPASGVLLPGLLMPEA